VRGSTRRLKNGVHQGKTPRGYLTHKDVDIAQTVPVNFGKPKASNLRPMASTTAGTTACKGALKPMRERLD